MKHNFSIYDERPIFTMVMGLPGSGKSTFVNEVVTADSLTSVVVSSDSLREELFGDVNDQTHNTEVFEEMHRRTIVALKEGKDVFYDATNLSGKRRKAFLNSLNGLKNKVHKRIMVFATPVELCIARNHRRERKVPTEVIERMYKSLTMPRYTEGWDSIIYWRDDSVNITPDFYYVDSIDNDHDSHWHPRSISDHMEAVYDYVEKNCDERGLRCDTILRAAKYHDVGKPYVKSRINNRGEVDTESHYYNHENVGAYILACCGENDYTVALVQYHMDIMRENYGKDDFDPRATKAYKDFVDGYGEKMAECLVLLNEADRRMA